MKQISLLLGALLTAGFLQSTRGAAPAPAALKAEILAGTDTYELDPAMAGKDFVEKARAAEKQNEPPAVRPPKVNLTLRLSNAGESDVALRIGGDESSMDLELKGAGAFSLNPRMMMTMEFRMGKPVILKPGEHQDIPIKSLASGAREAGKFSYWTEPGDYTLTATFNARSGRTQLKVRSEPLKLKVVKPAKDPAK